MRTSHAPPTKADILMLRHAATEWNEQGRRLGWVDQPLSAAGRRAARTWTGGDGVELAAVVCSDLKRAHETARILATALGVPCVAQLAGLREQDEGEWSGLTKDEIKRRWPQRARERPRRPVGGEDPQALLSRVLAALAEIADAHSGGSVLAVTHNGVIHAIERALGLAGPAIPPLEGRWFEVLAPREGNAEQQIASLRAGELTPGRRTRADARPATVVA